MLRTTRKCVQAIFFDNKKYFEISVFEIMIVSCILYEAE